MKCDVGDDWIEVMLVYTIESSNHWRAFPVHLLEGMLVPQAGYAKFDSTSLVDVDPHGGGCFILFPITFLRCLAQTSCLNAALFAQVLACMEEIA